MPRECLVREPELGLRGRPDYVLEYGAPNDPRLYPLEVNPPAEANASTRATSCKSALTSSRCAGLRDREPERVATCATRLAPFASISVPIWSGECAKSWRWYDAIGALRWYTAVTRSARDVLVARFEPTAMKHWSSIRCPDDSLNASHTRATPRGGQTLLAAGGWRAPLRESPGGT